MNQEVDEQGVLIDRLDTTVETSGTKMRAAQKRLDQLLKANGTDIKQMCCIVVLIIVVLILFITLFV